MANTRTKAPMRVRWAVEVDAALAEGSASMVEAADQAQGVVVQAASGLIVGADDRAATILGLAWDQLVGRTSRDPRWAAVNERGLPLGGDEHPAMRALATGATLTGFLMGVLLPDTMPGITPAMGYTRWILIDSHPICDADGAVIGVTTLFSDATQTDRGRAAADALLRAYRLLAENASDVVVLSSAEGMIQWVSPSITRVLGWQPSDLMGRVTRDFVHPDHLKEATRLQDELREGHTVHMDVPLRKSDGSYLWVGATVRPILDANGSVIGRVSGWRDIEAEQTALVALRASEERYRLIAENAYDVIWTMDPDMRVTYVSPSIERVRGFTPAEAAAQPLHHVHPPESLGRVLAYIGEVQRALRAGTRPPGFSGELEYFRRDGSIMTSEVQVVPMFAETGETLQFLAVSRDISERKAAIAELARSRQELAEAQEVGKVGSWSVDLRTGQGTWSDGAYRLLGYDLPTDGRVWRERAELWRMLGPLLDPDTAARLARLDDETVAAGEPYEVEYDLTRPDGRRLRILSRTAPVYDANGTIVGLRGSIADITDAYERSQLQARKLERRAEFLASAQHRLRTELSLVQGWAELLAEDEGVMDPEARRLAAAKVARSAAGFVAHLESLLSEAKQEARAQAMALREVDVAALAAEVASEYAVIAEGTQITAEPVSGVLALSGRDELETVLRHLLENAVEYAGAGGRVQVVTRPGVAGWVEVFVRDTGPGIEEKVTLFSPFSHGSRSKGHGLGLHIVRTLVEAMGGTVRGANRTDAPGAEFVVSLRAT